MSRKKAHAGGHANSERWLLTYADLITLLLIYFIVLFAMSQTDVAKYHKLADSMSNAFNVVPSEGGSDDTVLPPSSKDVIEPVAPMYSEEETQFQEIKQEVEKAFEKAGASGSVDVQETPRGLVIHIASSALFSNGSADVNPRMAGVLDGVARSLGASSNNVRVEGHTDDQPIHSSRYPSNWELSTARAVNVLHYLIERGHLAPSRLSAAGYGEYFPRVPNDSEANRSKNRRVDIVLLRDATMAQEPTKLAIPGISATQVIPGLPPVSSKGPPASQGDTAPAAPDSGLGEGY